MTKEVLLSIKGIQFDTSKEEGNVETITSAQYYERNGSHYLIYDEIVEGFREPTKNMIKFKENQLELTKKGLINVHMIFEEKKKNMSDYRTPYGNIMIGMDTQKVILKEEENHISIQVEYALEMNYEFLADCKIFINICPKEEAESII